MSEFPESKDKLIEIPRTSGCDRWWRNGRRPALPSGPGRLEGYDAD